jgi:hypothetical protein
MVDPKYDIEFTICYLNKEYRLKSCKNACGNLRDLIIQKVIDQFNDPFGHRLGRQNEIG